jgi:hypothetical protein
MNSISIFIRLIEGTVVLVPVKAKPMRGNLFEIIENPVIDLENDITSIWEFFPGDIVRVESFENGLIAKELVNSTFPKRKIYELIFKIVYSVGDITLEKVADYKEEIDVLQKCNDIPQKNHPLIQSWLKNISTANSQNM